MTEGVSYPALPKGKRLTAANLAGTVSRLAISDMPDDQKLAEILAVTGDPQILGQELGVHLGAEYPNSADAVAIELLRAAGADEEQAARNARWQRWRVQRRGLGRFADGL